MPNVPRQPEFAEALREAERSGVQVMAVRCSVRPEKVEIAERIPVILEEK